MYIQYLCKPILYISPSGRRQLSGGAIDSTPVDAISILLCIHFRDLNGNFKDLHDYFRDHEIHVDYLHLLLMSLSDALLSD